MLPRTFMYMLIYSLLIQGTYAIDVSFSASNGGESVGICNSYLVDDSVSVSERASASFNGVVMTDSREVSGNGDANMRQDLFGSGGGADWNADHIIWTVNAAGLRDKNSASLKPVSCKVSRSTDVWNSDIAAAALYGHQGGDHAVVSSYVSGGDLSDTQNLEIGHSVEVSQRVSMNVYSGDKYGRAYSESWDDDGNYAGTNVDMFEGELATNQRAKAADGSSAVASQSSEMVAKEGSAWSYAEDADGNWVDAHVWVTDVWGAIGELSTEQTVEAGDSAKAYQETYTNADIGAIGGRAVNHSDEYYFTVEWLKAVQYEAININVESECVATSDRVSVWALVQVFSECGSANFGLDLSSSVEGESVPHIGPGGRAQAG